MPNTKSATVILLVSALLLGGCSPANDAIFEWKCDRLPSTAAVVVEFTSVSYTLDNSLSVSDLTRQFPPTYAGRILGITNATLAKVISFNNEGVVQAGTGRVCLRPQIKINVAFDPMVVHVASDFPLNSCKYQEVFEHEMRHVQAYTEFLPTFAAEMESEFKASMGTDLQYFASKDESRQSTDTLIETTWMPYLAARMAEVQAAQQSIDTREEYERIARTCPTDGV